MMSLSAKSLLKQIILSTKGNQNKVSRKWGLVYTDAFTNVIGVRQNTFLVRKVLAS